MQLTRKIMTLALLITITLLSSCKDTGAPIIGGGEPPKFDIVTQCPDPANRDRPECIQACIEDQTHPWCVVEEPLKFTCPEDGSFKAVNPFSGEDIVFPEAPATVEIKGAGLMLAADTLKGEKAILSSKDAQLIISLDSASQPLSADLGAVIFSIDTFKNDGQYYAVAGTADNLKVVPFVYGTEIQAEGIKTFSKLGGITQVIVAKSVDISKSAAGKTLPPGMLASVNPPTGGAAEEAAASDINYVYLVTADGDVWRIKFAHLIGGGCVERLYSASENKMVASKIAVAGQYVVFLTSTANDKLEALPADIENFWKKYEGNLIDEKKSHKLITQDFYWLAHHLANLKKSEQFVRVLDLLTSKSGELKDVNQKPSQALRYYATDMLLKGNMLYLAAYIYNINNDMILKDPNVFENMGNIWAAAREGTPVEGSTLKDFANSAGAGILEVDVDKPLTVKNVKLPLPNASDPAVPSSIFTRISASKDKFYLRGENGYLAEAPAEKISGVDKIDLEDYDQLTPWLSIYDEATSQIISSFIFDLEKLGAGDL